MYFGAITECGMILVDEHILIHVDTSVCRPTPFYMAPEMWNIKVTPNCKMPEVFICQMLCLIPLLSAIKLLLVLILI